MTFESGHGSRWAFWTSVLGLTAVLLGCHHYYYSSRAYFANTTREVVKVRVQRLLATVDCTRAEGRSAELLAKRELFGPSVTYEVAPGEALPLDYEVGGSWSRPERCAALVQVLGFPDQLVFWARDADTVQTETKLAEANSAAFLAQSLVLEGLGDVRGLAAGNGLEVTPLPPVATGAPAIGDPPVSLGWSGVPRTGTAFTLLRREVLPDGCLSLTLGKEAASSFSLFLCVPDWSFPFEVGEELRVVADELMPAATGYRPADSAPLPRHLSISGGGVDLGIWLNASSGPVAVVGEVTGQGGPGRHTACGAYVEPASVALASPAQRLMPGEDVTIAVPGGSARVFLGRAEDVLVAREECGPEYSTLGARFDILILNEPAEKLP